MPAFNVAFLIICHKGEDQVARLISRLGGPNSTVFVHVDSESDINVDILRGGVRACK